MNLLINFLIEKLRDKKPFKKLEIALKEAKIKIPYTLYLKRLFTFTLISFFISILLLLLIFLLKIEVKIPFFHFIILSIPLFVFLSLYTHPFSKAKELGMKIEAELPFAISHLASIAESNLPPQVMIRILAGFEEYKGINREMKEILKRMEVYGMDFVSAIKSVSQTTPSPSLKYLLNSLATAIQSGGDIKGLLKMMYEKAYHEWKLKRGEEFVRKFSLLVEIYLGIVIMAPISLITLLALMSTFSIGGFYGLTVNDLLFLSIYLLIPALNLIFLFLFKGVPVEE